MLQRDADTGEYSVGPTMWALATTYIRDHPVLGVGLAHLEQALPHVPGLLKVTERCDSEAVTLFAEQNPQGPAIRRIREQYRLPLHCVSFGQVLLAFEDQEFIDAYLEQPLRRLTERTITDPQRLRDRLQEIRERGYAESRAELQGDNGSIAVPLLRKDGKVVAALAGVVPLRHFEDSQDYEQLRRVLQDCAVTISESLGWRAYHDTGFYAGI
jgi:DNA-binding IclR family transcriptional regulator